MQLEPVGNAAPLADSAAAGQVSAAPQHAMTQAAGNETPEVVLVPMAGANAAQAPTPRQVSAPPARSAPAAALRHAADDLAGGAAAGTDGAASDVPAPAGADGASLAPGVPTCAMPVPGTGDAAPAYVPSWHHVTMSFSTSAPAATSHR